MARVLRRRGGQASPRVSQFSPARDEFFTLADGAAAAAAHPPHEPVSPARARSRWPSALAVAFAIAIFVAVAGMAYDGLSASHFFPDTRIGGVKIGSRSLGEAEQLLNERLIAPLHRRVTLTGPHLKEATSAWDMGLRLELGDAITKSFYRQRNLPVAERVWRRVWGEDRNQPVGSRIDRERLTAFVASLAAKVDRPAQDARVEFAGDRLRVIRHRVGRKLDVVGAANHLAHAMSLGDRRIRLPVATTRPALLSEQFNRVILVKTVSNRLDLYLDRKLARTFPVATGSPGYPTPHGQFSITAMRRNPGWGNPGAPWSAGMPAYIPPGPNNPLGTRAMNLSVSGIRIHGTPNASSIGRPASHGCIRMLMHDAEALFDLVGVGTPVVIVRA